MAIHYRIIEYRWNLFNPEIWDHLQKNIQENGPINNIKEWRKQFPAHIWKQLRDFIQEYESIDTIYLSRGRHRDDFMVIITSEKLESRLAEGLRQEFLRNEVEDSGILV